MAQTFAVTWSLLVSEVCIQKTYSVTPYTDVWVDFPSLLKAEVLIPIKQSEVRCINISPGCRAVVICRQRSPQGSFSCPHRPLGPWIWLLEDGLIWDTAARTLMVGEMLRQNSLTW